LLLSKNKFIEKEFWNKLRQNKTNWNYIPLWPFIKQIIYIFSFGDYVVPTTCPMCSQHTSQVQNEVPNMFFQVPQYVPNIIILWPILLLKIELSFNLYKGGPNRCTCFYISSLGNDKCFKRNLQWANHMAPYKGGICFLVTPPACPPFF
jgi:hypothetical protein